MTKTMSERKPVATDLSTLVKFKSSSSEPDWIKDLRSKACEKFAIGNWPGRTDEEWRRSSISAFRLDERYIPSVETSQVESVPTRQGFAGHLIFSDGRLIEKSLASGWAEKGVWFGPLEEAWTQKEAIQKGWTNFSSALEEELENSDARVIPLHYALLQLGAVLVVPPNLVIEEPFLIEFREAREGVLSCPHLAIKVGRASQALLVVKSTSQDGVTFTQNSGTTLQLDEGAVFKLIDVQNLAKEASTIDHSRGHIARDAQLFHWSACLGAGAVKTRFSFFLDGEGSGLRTHGLYFGIEDQHKDIRIVQNHEAPRASSYALYKGAVRDRSHTVFQGLIEVKPLAVKTDAYLSNKNLILNDGARADSLPQLKIDTNDVKCSHGSTTGKVNEDEVYYLTARGFSVAEARLLLAEALFAELIDEAPEFLREEIETEVAKALGADVSGSRS